MPTGCVLPRLALGFVCDGSSMEALAWLRGVDAGLCWPWHQLSAAAWPQAALGSEAALRPPRGRPRSCDERAARCPCPELVTPLRGVGRWGRGVWVYSTG